MKTKIGIFAIFFTLILIPCHQVNLYGQFYGGSPFETINIPNSNLAGINPEDIIYANNKFYVWGLGAVLVINAENFNIITTLVLSKSAQYDYRSKLPLEWDAPHSKMAYNGNDRIYVLSPDNEIYVIDTQNDSFLDHVIYKPNTVPDYFFENSIIRYDSKNNGILWSISWMDNYTPRAHLEYYRIDEYDNFIQIWVNERNDTRINDIVFNKLTNYVYISCEGNKIEICPTNTSIYYVEETINTSGPNSKFIYITPTEENGLHRIYCLSYNNIYWINGSDNTHGSITAPANGLSCMAYNPQIDKLYISGRTNAYAYTASNPQGTPSTIPLDINGNMEYTYYMEYFYDRIYACKAGEIVTITANNVVSNLIQKENNYFYSAAYDPDHQNILFCNTIGGEVEIVNVPQTYYENPIVTGVSVFRSAYNPIDRKFYFYSDELHDDSKLVIVNYINNLYQIEDILNFTTNISSCAYNPNLLSHHLLISSYSPTNQIVKLNAETNETEGALITANDYCESIFISPEPENLIYCATGMNSLQTARIETFNATNYSAGIILPPLGDDNEPLDYRMKFCYDKKDNLVYFILFKRNYDWSTQWGYLGKINIKNAEHPLELIELLYSPEDISCGDLGGFNGIFIKNSNSRFLTVYDCDHLSDPPTITGFPEGTIIMDIEYANNTNNLYVLTSDGICQQYCRGGCSPLHQYELSEFVTSMRWNPIDKKLYVFSPYDITRNHESWMYIIDVFTAQIYEELLGNNTIWRYEDYLTNNEMLVDSYSGRLLCPNGSHSNISVSPEEISLTANKWNWLSFPRLDRSNGDPSPEQVLDQDNFSSGYTQLEMDHLETNGDNEYMTTVTWDVEHFWQYNLLDRIYSEKGYKLHLDPVLGRSLVTYGTVLDPQTPLTLYPEKHNWVGYFLPYPQNPFIAIPKSITDNLYSMVSQYWSCYNYALIQPPPPTKSTATSAQWRCACNQLKMELKYGDMVILHSKPQQTLTWNQGGAIPKLNNKEAPEHFGFEEKADYTSYFIELDTNNLPDEIGAYAGDSCIGATKVLASDTTLLICAYDKGFEGQEITFQTFWPTKSYRPIINDYQVLNTVSGIREKRRIIAGEKQPFYVISFKDKPVDQSVPTDAWLSLSPNPASHEVLLSYFIPEHAYVTVKITGIVQGEWYSIDRGTQDPGEYKLNINSLQLPAGCYLVNLCFNNKSITEKLMILK
jgi:hypothetical protein